MVLVLRNAYLSIVADRNNTDSLIVRARRTGHIERVFPDACVIARPDTEYRYRAFISRLDVGAKMTELARQIDYHQFDCITGEGLGSAARAADSVQRMKQQEEPFPIAVGGRYPVIRSDWKAIPMKERRTAVPVSIPLSRLEFELVQLGLRPDEMEDKWFLYFEDPVLHCHRSWTGFEAFSIRIREHAEGAEITEIVVSQSADEVNYERPDEGVAQAIEMLRYALFHTQAGSGDSQEEVLANWHAHGHTILGRGPVPGIEYRPS